MRPSGKNRPRFRVPLILSITVTSFYETSSVVVKEVQQHTIFEVKSSNKCLSDKITTNPVE